MYELWNEDALIEAAKQDDLDALNTLIQRYQGRAFGLAYSLLHDAAAADDAVQEAFISAYYALKGFKNGSFRAWLLRIVVNASYDEMRRRKRRPLIFWDDNEEMDRENDPYLRDESRLPEDIIQQHELGEILNRALMSLPKSQRLAIVLIDQLGFSYEEAAETTQQALGTIKSRLSRARRSMRKWLIHEKVIVERYPSPNGPPSHDLNKAYVSLAY